MSSGADSDEPAAASPVFDRWLIVLAGLVAAVANIALMLEFIV